MSVRLDERFRLLTRRVRTHPARNGRCGTRSTGRTSSSTPASRSSSTSCRCSSAGSRVEAAAAVSGVSVGSVGARSVALVDRSLVTFSMVDVTSRYQLLETIRHFGLEHLDQMGSLARTRDRAHALLPRTGAAPLVPGMPRTRRGPDHVSGGSRASWRTSARRSTCRRQITFCVEAAELVVAPCTSTPSGGSSSSSAHGHRPPSTCPIEQPTRAGPPRHRWMGRLHRRRLRRCGGTRPTRARRRERGGVECGWLHDVLAHCAYFQGDARAGLGTRRLTRSSGRGPLATRTG